MKAPSISHRLDLNLPYHGAALRMIVCMIDDVLAMHPSPNAKVEYLEEEVGEEIAESWTSLHDIKEQLEAAADRVDEAWESVDC